MSLETVESVMHLPPIISAMLVQVDDAVRNSKFKNIFARAQANAIIELMAFCNRYVLDDHLILYGTGADVLTGDAKETDWGQFIDFIHTEVEYSGVVTEIPPKDHRYPYLWRTEAAPPNKTYPTTTAWIYRELAACREIRTNVNQFPNPQEVRALHLLMMLSDYRSADYVIDGLNGYIAAVQYPEFLRSLDNPTVDRQPFHSTFEEFRDRFFESMRQPVRRKDIEILAKPSFLLEAARQSDRPEAIFHVLRDFRNSPAAIAYREANRTRLYATNIRERQEANATLKHQIDESFISDGLKSRVPQWTVTSLGLAVAGVGLFFQELAPTLVTLVPATLTVDFIRQHYCSLRRNIFTEFFGEEGNLHTELERVFGGLLCSREQLAEAMTRRQETIKRISSQEQL